MHTGLFAPVGIVCSTKSPEHHSVCQQLLSLLVTVDGQNRNASAGDFISVVLIRTLPGALSRLILPSLQLFCFPKDRFVVSTLLLVLPLNWMHSKIISVSAFRIIGLTKIPKIELLPLDWIYHFIRIMKVC